MATLALLLERLLERRLNEAGLDFGAAFALEAASTIRLVEFRVPDGPPRRGTSRGSPHAAQVLNAFPIPDRLPQLLRKGKKRSCRDESPFSELAYKHLRIANPNMG